MQRRRRTWRGDLLAGEDGAIHVCPLVLLGGVGLRAGAQELLLLVRDGLGGVGGALAADSARLVRALVRLKQFRLVEVFKAARAEVLERVLAVDVFPVPVLAAAPGTVGVKGGETHLTRWTSSHPGPQQVLTLRYFAGSCLQNGQANFLPPDSFGLTFFFFVRPPASPLTPPFASSW